MSDAVIQVGPQVVEVNVRGAQGPRGFNGPDLTDLAASDGAEKVGANDHQTVDDVLKLEERVTSYGADPTEATNSSAAFDAANTAAGTGGRVTASPGNFKTDIVSILDGQTWEGNGARVKALNDGQTVFFANGAHNWRLSGFTLVGSRTTSVDPDDYAEFGVAIRDASPAIVSNLMFYDFKSAGLVRNATGFTAEAGRGARTLGYGLGFYNSSIGIQTTLNGGNEYDVFSIFHVGGCDVGIDTRAGNTILTAFQSIDNLTNFFAEGTLSGDDNHLHIILSAGALNHAADDGYLAHFKNIRRGVTMNAIHAYGGSDGESAMFYDKAACIFWNGGTLDAWTYVGNDGLDAEANYPYSFQQKLFLPGDSGPAEIVNLDDVGNYHPHLIRRDCRGPGVIDSAGVTTNDPYDLFVWAQQSTTVAFAQGDFLKFSVINRIGDRRKVYNPLTGLVTIPPWMDGLFDYEAGFVVKKVGAGVLVTPETCYFEVVTITSTGTNVISPFIVPRPYGTGDTRWWVDTGIITEHLSAGDQIGIRATQIGGAPGLGEPGWRSKFTLRKIA